MTENENMPQNENIFEYENLFNERKAIREYRGAARVIGIPYLFCFCLTVFWSRIYLFCAAKLGVSVESAVDFVNSPDVNHLLQIFLSVLCFTVPFALAVILSGQRVSDVVSLSKPKKSTVFPYLLLGISFCFFSNVAVSVCGEIFESFGIDYSITPPGNPDGIFGFLIVAFSTCAVPALVEEFAFRGVVMGSLLRFGESFAIFSSALLFGIMHGNFEQMPFAILVGIALGFIRVKTGSIWVSVLVHFLNNFVSVVFSYISSSGSQEALDLIYVVFVALAMVLLLPSIFISEKRFGKEAFSLENSDRSLKEWQKYRYFLTAPIIAVSIVFYIVEAFKYFL